MDHRSTGFVLILLSFSLISCFSQAYGYDVLDPSGKVTIRWDVMQDNGATQDVKLWVFNYQLYRHVDYPGWKLSWTWPGDEVIWNMWGAEAVEQGNCSAIKGQQLPHCCEKEPVIIDLLPGAPYNKQVANCCKGGVLSSLTQDPDNSVAAFQMNVGVSSSNGSMAAGIPANFTLGLPGYTCGQPVEVAPSKFIEDHGRRRTQALATWNVSCSYSQFIGSPAPMCCVSLSAFYNDTIVRCPTCSCGCEGAVGQTCVKPGELPPVLQLLHNEAPQPAVKCTRHMCPIKVHWHVKTSYKEYWRVKITITNLNLAQNYSQWNLVVSHPNLKSVTQVFSFNYKPLDVHGSFNDTGVFYGLQHYNEMLLQSGINGSVQSELLLHKDPQLFTFREGWAFPRRISFNGDECVMAPPDEYPRLPNSGQVKAPASCCIILLSCLLLTLLI